MNTVTEREQAQSKKRYGGLTALMILFFLLAIVLLAGNFYLIKQSNQNQRQWLSGSQQSDTLVRLSENISELGKTIRSNAAKGDAGEAGLPEKVRNILTDITAATNQFETVLNAQEKGGTVSQGSETWEISALRGEEAQTQLSQLRALWNPYAQLADKLSENNAGIKAADELTVYVGKNQQALLNHARSLERLSVRQMQQNHIFWNIVQAAFAIGSVLLCGLVLLLIIKKLKQQDRKIEEADRELSDIMASVPEGLFLIDQDLNIGSRYSASLENILGKTNLANENLIGLLGDFVSKEELDTAKTFIDHLYHSDWVVEELIEDLNPLHRIGVQTGNGLRFMDFKFFRVFENGKVSRILTRVTDSTEAVMLQSSEDSQKDQEGRELEMLRAAMDADPHMLAQFVKNNQEKLQEIRAVMHSPEEDQKELKGRAVYISRLIHGVKGDASALQLSRIASLCETFEESLIALRKAPSIDRYDFLNLTPVADDLLYLIDIISEYSSRIEAGRESSINQSGSQAQIGYFKQFVRDLAQRNGKQAELVCQGFEESVADTPLGAKLKDIVIQLLRNAVVHGIEKPEVRLARNKPQSGLIRLKLFRNTQNDWVLQAEDDGNGIDFDAIREQAVALGMVRGNVADLQTRHLLNIMLSSGFSTAQEQTEDAGRGIGMDIVKDAIASMGGKISINTAPGGYTRFVFTIPNTPSDA